MPRPHNFTAPAPKPTHTIPSGMGGIFSVRILSELAEERVLVGVVNQQSDFHGKQFRPLRSELRAL